MVVKPGDNGKYIPVGGANANPVTSTVSEIDGIYSISYLPVNKTWVYQLPITPQQLSISSQFASTADATLNGIVEQRNGVKFKMINMSGTFGVWPYRGSFNDAYKSSSPNSLETLFSGTIEAFSGLTQNLNNLAKTVGSSSSKTPTIDVENYDGGASGTGYAQALLLDQFLEQYAELSKLAENADWRLVLDIPKQNQSFLVSSAQFTYAQSSEATNEYKFAIQLKAYKRISIEYNEADRKLVNNVLSTSSLRKVLNAITEARKSLSSAYNLVRAVRSDFNKPFNALREMSIFVKDFTGLIPALADLPDNIIQDSRRAISDSISNLKIAEGNLSFDSTESLQKTISQFISAKSLKEGQPFSVTSSSIEQRNREKTSPTNKVFEIPAKNFELLNTVDVTSVNFSNSAQDAIQTERDRISLLTADDLKTHRDTIQELAYQISNAYGTGDADFSRIYKKPAPKTRLQEITIDEYALLKQLYDVVQLSSSLYMTDAINQNQNAAYDFVKAEAQDANIPFQDSPSKIRKPVPFGLTIEQISARYLSNQERWLEIATLNNLKSPYIDEVGFTRLFLSNGDGRQFNINSNENLFVGQKVYLYSNNQTKQRRTIINIEKITESNYLITIDGLDNLQIFTTVQESKMLAYLPGTVNSQDQIYIPSDLPVPADLVTRPIPATQDDQLTGLSKVDLLLMDNNDIAVDSFGDLKLAYGLTNLSQALKLKFITEPGQLIRHPDFGSGLRPGMSLADTSAKNVYRIVEELIKQDPRYSGIQKLTVNINGPVLTVFLSVYVANGLGVFPISFNVVM
jgi:hypothetical protein